MDEEARSLFRQSWASPEYGTRGGGAFVGWSSGERGRRRG